MHVASETKRKSFARHLLLSKGACAGRVKKCIAIRVIGPLVEMPTAHSSLRPTTQHRLSSEATEQIKGRRAEKAKGYSANMDVQAHLQLVVKTAGYSTDDAMQLSANLRGTIVESTSEQYSRHWKKYVEWHRTAHPGQAIFDQTTDHGLDTAIYISHILTGCKDRAIGPGTVDSTLSAIRHYYSMAGHQSITHPFLTALTSSAHRTLKGRTLAREPLSVRGMHQVLQFHLLNQDSSQIPLRKLMHLVVLLVSFVGLLRYDDAASILVGPEFIQFKRDATGRDLGVLIFIPRSKTDTKYEGQRVAIGATGGNLCPVRWLRILLARGYCIQAPPGLDTGPLLRAVRSYKGQEYLAQVTSPLPISPLGYESLLKSAKSLVQSA